MASTKRINSVVCVCCFMQFFIAFVFMLSFTALKSEGQQLLCSRVVESVAPCVDYAFTGGETVPQECCDNIKQISATKDDRQQVCKCAKNFAPMIPGLNYEFVANIPKKCGVNVTLEISLDIDCAKLE